MPAYEVLVETTRGGILESAHVGALVLVNTEGEHKRAIGDPRLVSFPRSSLKPFQLVALVARGGLERFGLTTADLAICAASHGGEGIHVQAAQSVLRKIDAPESALACGIHAPSNVDAAARLDERGEQPSAIHNNCSGKHAGMLALARLLGAPLEGYLNLHHPVQVAIRETLIDVLQLEAEKLRVGIDGCSAPAYAVPLDKLARGFAVLGKPAAAPEAWRGALEKISAAMRLHPELVGGTTGRVDTDLMRVSRGDVVAKGGAEGYFGFGHRDGLGVALKILDGDASRRARSVAVVTLAGQLGWANVAQLAGHGPCVPITNWAGLHTGELRPGRALSGQANALPTRM